MQQSQEVLCIEMVEIISKIHFHKESISDIFHGMGECSRF